MGTWVGGVLRGRWCVLGGLKRTCRREEDSRGKADSGCGLKRAAAGSVKGRDHRGRGVFERVQDVAMVVY